jgi:lipopolysaccharide transport system permease protein
MHPTSEESTINYFNPFRIVRHLWQYRELIRQLAYREVLGRYKGSFLGLAWSVLHPLLMLVVYTFVFSVIFKARWGVDPEEGRAVFAFTLFIGLITFGLFAELVNAAPTLILYNASFVKKVVFPLEVLVVVRFLSITAHSLFSLAILLLGLLFAYGTIPWTALALPVAWLPIMLFSLGCAYFLASLGVFIRDVGSTVSIVTTVLFFLTPIFYPLRLVPEQFQIVCRVNPLALYVEDARRVLLWGMLPEWPWFLLGLMFSTGVCILGFAWFMKSKKTFADVI